MDQSGGTRKRAVPLVWLLGAALTDDLTAHRPAGARSGQGTSRGQTLRQATRSAKLWCRAPWPCAVRAAVAAILLCGAAPAATVQAQDGTPTAPRDLAAAPGDTMVTLTWSPPANDGGSDITGYEYQVDEGDWEDAGAADARSLVVSDLENIRLYAFSVRAVNGTGPGAVATVEAKPRAAITVPTIPRDVAAEPGDAVVTLTWSPPADDGGSAITGYQYQVDQRGWQLFPTPYTGPAYFYVENGREYTFSMRAVNRIGTGPTASVKATPRGPPSAPRNLAASPGDTEVTLTWEPPAEDGGSDVTGYEYQVDQENWEDAGAADARSVVVSDLENGRSYRFSVRAENGIGPGTVEMVEATPRPAAVAPTAPRDLAAASGDTMVTLTWSPPANDGGSDITGYEYQVDEEDWEDAGAAEARSLVVSDLENIRLYAFSVRAVNGTGPGAVATVEAKPRAAITAPTAPRDLAAEPGDTKMSLSWLPPADDGGSDITDYQIQGGGVTSWTTVPLPELVAMNFYNLENGREYTFSVRAVNRIGPGATASVKATPRGAPSAPRNLAASPGDTEVTLTWEPPAEDGGSDVTGYQYQVDEEDWTNAGAADARSVVVSDLENGRSYTFSVRAVNALMGLGAVEMIEATPRPDAIAPTAPRDLAAASGNTMVTLTWSAPANDGGSDVTGYEYQVDQEDWKDAGAADARSVVVSGLENNRQYAFSVRAVNGVEPGTAATVQAAPRAVITAPTAPRDLAAEPGDNVVTLTWEPPADDGGSAITGYQYQVDQRGWQLFPTPYTGPAYFYVENGREYTFSMRAVNRIGPGPTASVKATPRGAPSGPRNLAASPRDAQVTLTWEPAAADGGSSLSGYEYQVDQGDWKDGGTANARSVVVSGLENGRSYTFSVRAVNGIGTGVAETVEATPRPDAIAPKAPRDLRVTPRDSTVTLTWEPPANDGGSEVKGYQYQVDQRDWKDGGTAVARSVVVSGLENGRTYLFSVRAVNEIGTGLIEMVEATPRPAAVAPTAPRDLAAAPGDAGVTLTWSPPADDGGSALTGYQYQVDQGDWINAGAAAARSVVVSGLESVRSYIFSVRAVNGTGPGAVATVLATPRGVPSAPRNLAAEPGVAEVTLTWSPPADDGGSAVTGYQYRVDQGNWINAGAAAARSVVVSGLESGRQYRFAVRAVNGIGPGAVATVLATPRGVPSAPRNLAGAPGDAEVTLTWSPPADDGGSAVTGYQYQVDQGNWINAGAAAARSVVVSGLENGRLYTFAVRAVNGVGPGPAAEAIVRLNRPPVFERPGYSFEVPEHRDGSAQPVELGSVTAEDPDGGALTYVLSSGDRERFAVRSGDGALTYIGPGENLAMEPNRYDLTVLARDPLGAEALALVVVTVTVNDHLVQAVAGDTLAAMGRGHLASARMMLGRRGTAGRGEQSRLTVMGQSVPLGTAAAHAAAERMAMSLLSPMDTATNGARGRGLGWSSATGRQPGAARAPGGFGGGWNQGLTGTNFLLAQGDGDPGEAGLWRRFTVWGQGDVQTFRGAPSTVSGYEGDVRTAYLGVDSRLTDRWLAGVALARSGAAGDWRAGGARGRMTTTLTAVHPYLRWSDGATSVWTMVGGGRGAVANERAVTGGEEASGLGLRLGVVEVRRRLGTLGGGVQLGLRGDAAWARLTTEAGDETIDALRVAVNQTRVGVELTRPFRTSNGLALAPFGELNMRRDGGAGQRGDGLELAGGLRASRGTIRVDAQARLLALHSADGYQERGASVTFSVGEGARRPGLTLSLAPRWGNRASSGALWQDHVYRRDTHGAAGEERAMDARVDYGVRSFGGRLLTSFGVYGQSQYGRRLQVGTRLSSLGGATSEFLQVEISGERYSRPGGAVDSRVILSGLITFGGRDRNVEASRGLRDRTVPR